MIKNLIKYIFIPSIVISVSSSGGGTDGCNLEVKSRILPMMTSRTESSLSKSIDMNQESKYKWKNEDEVMVFINGPDVLHLIRQEIEMRHRMKESLSQLGVDSSHLNDNRTSEERIVEQFIPKIQKQLKIVSYDDTNSNSEVQFKSIGGPKVNTNSVGNPPLKVSGSEFYKFDFSNFKSDSSDHMMHKTSHWGFHPFLIILTISVLTLLLLTLIFYRLYMINRAPRSTYDSIHETGVGATL